MRFHYADLETCREADGMVVVIDVIRAFTNAAFAFSRGAKEIRPVGTVEEGLQFPETDILHGLSLDRFDFAMPIRGEDGNLVMHAIQPT
jgi:2-phosphosulfolactate phosphatase